MDGLGVALLVGMFSGYAVVDQPAQPIMTLGTDYFAPRTEDRQIHTVNLAMFVREKKFASIPLTLRLGGMYSHAWGNITQLEGEWADGTLHEVQLDSPGNGIGPATEASLRLWQGEGRWQPSLSADVLTGVLIYDRRFPAGGDYYNGTFQGGLSLSFTLSPQDSVSIGYRAMHTSNGQGLKPENPGLNANGISIRWTGKW